MPSMRALAGARVAHDAHHLPRFHRKAHVIQHEPAAIAKRDVLEADLPAHLLERQRILGFDHARDAIQNVEQALRGGRSSLRHREYAAHALHARVEATDVRDERREHADRDAMV
jgi:hypothetical protein